MLLLDLQMPDGSSVEVIRRLRAQVPETEIVVLTTEDSPVFARHDRRGAVGFVLRGNADEELASALRCAARGERYVSPRVAARLDVLRRWSPAMVSARERPTCCG